MAVKTTSCPACGGTVEFRSAMSLVTVCPYCQSVVARQDRKIVDQGKVAEIAESLSPLQLGLKGVWKGKSFRLIGRVQYRHVAGGTWDEWYVEFANQKWGWLSEAQGRFGMLVAVRRGSPDPAGTSDRRSPLSGSMRSGGQETGSEDRRGRETRAELRVPAYESLSAGESLNLGSAGEFQVAEVGHAVVLAAEGELPFSPILQATHRFVDLEGPGDKLATIEYGDEEPQVFVGESATLLELGLAAAALKQESVEKVSGAHLNCPQCAGPLELVQPDAAQRVTCPNCGALNEVVGNKLEYLETLKPPKPPLKIPLGKKGKLKDIEYRVLGYLRRSVTYDKNYYWQEYLLYSPRDGYAWLIDSDDHWSLAKSAPIGSVERSYPTATCNGRTFQIFQKAEATVRQVWGEFYWKVAVGESVGMNDYISPPFSLTLEISSAYDAGRASMPSEINATVSEYLPVDEVEKAFGVTGLPRSFGVAPNQPNPVTAAVYLQWLAFLAGIWMIYAALPAITHRSVDFPLTVWAILLVSLMPIGSWLYSRSFEMSRWRDSEFNPYAISGDSDDE